MARSSSNPIISPDTARITQQPDAPRAPAPAETTRVVPRIIWMAAGPAFVLLSAAVIANGRGSQLGWIDVQLWFAAGVAVLARWLDIRLWNGTTVDHEPATMKDWRAYALRILAVAGGGWALGHGVHWVF